MRLWQYMKIIEHIYEDIWGFVHLQAVFDCTDDLLHPNITPSPNSVCLLNHPQPDLRQIEAKHLLITMLWWGCLRSSCHESSTPQWLFISRSCLCVCVWNTSQCWTGWRTKDHEHQICSANLANMALLSTIATLQHVHICRPVPAISTGIPVVVALLHSDVATCCSVWCTHHTGQRRPGP